MKTSHEKSAINNSTTKVHYSFNKSPRFTTYKPVTLTAHYSMKGGFESPNEDSSAIHYAKNKNAFGKGRRFDYYFNTVKQG